MRVLLPLLCALAMGQGLSHAAQAAAGPQDLVSVFRLAQREDSTYRLAQAERELARQDAQRAGLVYLPAAQIERGRSPFESQDRTTLQVVQPVIDMDKWHTYQQMSVRQRAAEVAFQRQEVDLAQRIYQAMADWIDAQALTRLAEAESKALDKQVQRTRRRFALGWGTVLDVSSAQIQHTQALAKFQALQGQLMGARTRLQSMLHQSDLRLDVLPDYAAAAAFDPQVLTAQAQSLEAPSVIQARVELDVAHSEQERARWYWVPQVNAIVRASQYGGAQDRYAGLQIAMPTGVSAFAHSSMQRADLAVARAQAALADAQDQSRLDAQSADFALRASVNEMRLRSDAVRLAQENVQATEKAYEAGVTPASAVVDAILASFDAQRQRLSLHMNLARESLRLQLAQGQGAETAMTQTQRLFRPTQP